jgi:hypothetical protein
MQHACAPLAVDLADTTLLQAMREAVGVLYNHTKDAPCYELPGTLRQRRPLAQGAALCYRARDSCAVDCLACRGTNGVGTVRTEVPTDPCSLTFRTADYPSAQTPSASIDGQWDWQW